jgi:acetyl/propionyl-CoA carboxylase alpha subunit
MQLYNRNDLRDARIFFDKKPPAFLTVFICFVAVILILTVVIARYVDKPYIVKAEGTVTTTDNQYLSSYFNGEVKSIVSPEGTKVKAGDTLLVISNGQQGLQGPALQKQIEHDNNKLAIMDHYKQSLDQKTNYMKNTGEEQEYYGKVNYYLLQVKSDAYNTSNTTAQLNQKQQEKSQLQADITQQQSILNKPDATDQDKQTAQGKIDSDNSTITNLNSDITQLQQQLNQPTSQSKQMYAQLIGDLGTERTQVQSNLVQLEGQFNVQTGQEAPLVVKANNDGFVHYLVPLKEGMAVQQNQVLGEISKNTSKSLEVEAYIPATDISKIQKGDKVNVALSGVDNQKYGTLNGILKSIDAGTITQQTDKGNTVYYRCIVKLENLKLKSSDGSTVKAIKSMPVEARVVYQKETYYDWVLKMLDFKK